MREGKGKVLRFKCGKGRERFYALSARSEHSARASIETHQLKYVSIGWAQTLVSAVIPGEDSAVIPGEDSAAADSCVFVRMVFNPLNKQP